MLAFKKTPNLEQSEEDYDSQIKFQSVKVPLK